MATQWNNNTAVRADLNAHNFEPHTSAETLAHLDALIVKGEEIDQRKMDTKAKVNQLRSVGGMLAYTVSDVQRLIGGAYGISPTRMTDHAWGQLLAKLSQVVFSKRGIPRLDLIASGMDEPQTDNGYASGHMPKRYLEAIHVDLLDTILNFHFEHAPTDRAWWIRSITKPDPKVGEDNDTIRALVGNRYPVTYGNTALIKTVRQLIGKHADKFPAINLVRPDLGDDDLHMRVIYYERNTDDGPYGLGFYLGNSELGRGFYNVNMMIQRHACTNSIVIDRQNCVHVIHNGSEPTIREQIYNAIGTALKLSDDVLDEFLATREVALPDFDDVLSGLAMKYGAVLDEQVTGIARIAAREGQGGETKFGLINGLTFAAHAAKDLTARTRAELELFGGGLIAAPNSLFDAAARAAKAKREGREPVLNFAVPVHYGANTDSDE
jgi:hypothetical protein